MNGTKSSRANRFLIPLTAIWMLMLAGVALYAQAPHLTVPVEGGMPGLPMMQQIKSVGSNSVEVQWDGPSGLYRLMRKLDLEDTQWQEIVPWTTDHAALVTAQQEKEFFSVIGPSPVYAGSETCLACHPGIHDAESQTRHASALETLKRIGQGNNPSCLPCHVVGYGLPTGFTTEAATPNLAGVQCENCHGPAGLHAADPSDMTVVPQIEIAGQLCGGCHTDAHHPTYDEWSSSGHASVVEDMNGGRIDRCGRCHSGSSRLVQLAGLDPVIVEGDANVGITCVVCHNPHEVTENGHQLRNPTTSTNDYFITTSGTLLSQYNPNVNVCAQCHNHRGASWTSSSRPPHHSPQYNIMLGTVGLLPSGWTQYGGGHGNSIQGQCATCHMQTEGYVSEESPANTGHAFEVYTYDACLDCHSQPEGLVDFTTAAVSARILEVKNLLDEWGKTTAPEPLRTEYGALAWEYQNPGDLSPGASSADTPDAAQQNLIPDNIKQARFNAYLVLYDGSRGVHNGPYSLQLLDAAEEWVLEEINPAEALMFELERVP